MYSMTGYGKGTASDSGRSITIELKSVNHRFLDLGFRLPRHLMFLEDTIRTALSRQLARGHVDIFVNYLNTRTDSKQVILDTGLIGSYLASAAEAGKAFSLENDLTLYRVLSLQGVTEIREADENEDAVRAICESALAEAVAALRSMRLAEGERLKADLSARLDVISGLAEQIALRAPLVVTEYQAKLTERINALLKDVEADPSRIAMEVAIFADRASIDEEIVRLRSHVSAMRQLFSDPEPAGRKLDFIVQEMNREFNTIGSKANDGVLTDLVIRGKAEIEKIREQIQNIE